MTARYEVQWRHPADCEVCDRGQVRVSRLRFRDGQQVPVLLSLVVPCPHCRGAEGLLALLGSDRVVVPGGSA